MSSPPPALTCQAVYLLSAVGTCYACTQLTRLFGLMALPPFTFADVEDFSDDDGFMLSSIEDMDPSLVSHVARTTEGRWRSDQSITAGRTYWMNHCERCDAKQGDRFVHGPDGPFWPYTAEDMDAI